MHSKLNSNVGFAVNTVLSSQQLQFNFTTQATFCYFKQINVSLDEANSIPLMHLNLAVRTPVTKYSNRH